MNRIEFMEKLEALLQDVSEGERNEAIQYYNDYFDDAGSENEGKIIEQLNSPEKVAAIIKAGLNDEAVVEGEFTEKGYQDARFETRQEIMSESKQYDFTDKEETENPKKMSTGKIVIIVILCIFASPILISLITGVGGAVFGIIAGVFGILIGIFSTAAALLVSGIVMVGVGIAKLFIAPATGLALCGGGLIVLAIGILFLLLTVWIVNKVIPLCIKGIKSLFRKVFPKKGGSRA